MPCMLCGSVKQDLFNAEMTLSSTKAGGGAKATSRLYSSQISDLYGMRIYGNLRSAGGIAPTAKRPAGVASAFGLDDCPNPELKKLVKPGLLKYIRSAQGAE